MKIIFDDESDEKHEFKSLDQDVYDEIYKFAKKTIAEIDRSKMN